MPRTHRRPLAGFLIALTLLLAGFLIHISLLDHSSSVQPLSLKKGVVEESTRTPAEVEKKVKARAGDDYGRLPLSFEVNRGQVDGHVKYLSHGDGYNLYLTSTEAVLALSKHEETARAGRAPAVKSGEATQGDAHAREAVLRMRLVNANPAAEARGVDEQSGKSNYFIGNDPAKWQRDVTQYARVRYSDVYPGVSLLYYGNQRQLEYDFEVAAGTDPSSIKLAFDGADEMKLNEDGSLLIRTRGGELVQHKPVVYQEFDGERREIAGRYLMKGEREVSFDVGEYDRSRPLVIDPVLSYSTYLGGNYNDIGYAIAVDALGNAYITGVTSSLDFPTVNPLPSGHPEGAASDFVFVSKLNAAGSALVYSTYLGRIPREIAHGIAVDRTGNAYITGFVNSPDFPVVNAYQPNLRGSDAFVTKLNPTGSALVYSTYLGGSADEEGDGIAVDASGNAYVTGRTVSGDFPTANPAQAHYGGNACSVNNPCWDTFITKFNPSGSALVYSTFLGGERNDFGYGIAVDSQENAYVTGFTASVNFPTTANVLQPQYSDKGTNSEEHDAFVTKLSSAGSFVYSTYLGGARGSDDGKGIAVDSDGNAYVAGGTNSGEFPVVNAAQPVIAAGGNGAGSQFSDAFVSKINPTGSALVYSTYLGGGSSDSAQAIALDSAGNAYVTGYAGSGFPIVNPFQTHPNIGGHDSTAFVTKLNATGSAFTYSSYLGGSGGEEGDGIAVDSTGGVYVTGATYSTDFPTVNPFDATIGGTFYPDAFVSKISDNAQPSSLSISALQPDKGGNIGYVTVTIHGDAFANGATVKLAGAGLPDIAASYIRLDSKSLMTARFDLSGQTPAARDVVVTNPNGATITRAGAFTVEAGVEPQIWVQILGRNAIRPGEPQTYYIAYGNRGNVDAVLAPIMISMQKNVDYELGFDLIDPPQPVAGQTYDFSKIPAHYETATEKVIPLLLGFVPAGQSDFLKIRLTSHSMSQSDPPIRLSVRTGSPTIFTPSTLATSAGESTAAPDASHAASSASPDSIADCIVTTITSVTTCAIGFIPGGGCVNAAAKYSTNTHLSVITATSNAAAGTYTPRSGAIALTRTAAGGMVLMAECAGSLTPGVGQTLAAINCGFAANSIANSCFGFNLFEEEFKLIFSLFGIDPNDKFGPTGIGAGHYLNGTEQLSYMVQFENLETANGAAQTVVVTDQLDPAKLDFDTFNLGPIFFGVDKKAIPPSGLSEYTADVDLRPQQNIIAHVEAKLDKTTGLVTWRFTSLNPATGLPTDDPFAGFLPPNKNAPEGEGQVLFTVQAKKTLATGTEIRNKARIVFDTNAPIDTPEWLNTIDNSKPVSHVLSLAATQDSVIFNVSWSGTDTGSGVRSYTIFVSENGTPFTAWMSNTTALSGTFIGQPGKTYSFYSVAQDQTGNQEQAKTVAEATTTTTSAISNSIDDPKFFVRQQYLDFLNREPDTGGLGYWTNEITKCGSNAVCIHDRRVGTADAFFFEQEFQQTGAYIYRIYRAALGRRPVFAEFMADRGSVVFGPGLDASKNAYALSFVGRDDFLGLYARTQPAGAFVDTLLASILQHSGADLSSQRSSLVSLYDGTDNGRAAILRQVADSQAFLDAEYNSSFVLMEYFGYLRRDPDDGGYGFWLAQVNKFPLRNVSIQHAMACSFITSAEYQLRFGAVVTHTNRECPQ